MKSIRSLLAPALLGLAAGLATPLQAQTAPRAAPASAAAEAPMTEAEVRKVDREYRKITLRHGAIKNLDMPPMTMVFEVADPALLGSLKKGDKVKFAAVDEGGGKLKVTAIELLK
jgi:Cu(I)/Ag(I) efflux system periplasmic protein CusF